MSSERTVRTIRESLQVIQDSAEEHKSEPACSWKATEKILREVKRIATMVARLEVELSCPLEKECPRNGGKHA